MDFIFQVWPTVKAQVKGPLPERDAGQHKTVQRERILVFTVALHPSSWEYWKSVLTLHTWNCCFEMSMKHLKYLLQSLTEEDPLAEFIILLEDAHRAIRLEDFCLHGCFDIQDIPHAYRCAQNWEDSTVMSELRWDSNVAKAHRYCTPCQNTLCTEVRGWDYLSSTCGIKKGTWGPE